MGGEITTYYSLIMYFIWPVFKENITFVTIWDRENQRNLTFQNLWTASVLPVNVCGYNQYFFNNNVSNNDVTTMGKGVIYWD